MSNLATAGKVGIVFLHGSGSNGRDLKSFLSVVAMKEFNFQSFTEVCEAHRWHLCTPTAPMRHYTPDGCEERNVWFDRSAQWHDSGLADENEDVEGTDESIRQVLSTVETLCHQHCEIEHVFVGGFSMGGATSLHLLRNFFNTKALETNRNMPVLKKIRGIFVFSSFLVQSSVVFRSFKTANFELAKSVIPLPQVFMAHGDSDSMVPEEWASVTAAMLLQFGVDIQLDRYKGVDHEFTMQQLQDLIDWMRFVVDADISAHQASRAVDKYADNTNGRSDAKIDAMTRDMKSSGLGGGGRGSDSEEEKYGGGDADTRVRTAEQSDKQYYDHEQQLSLSRAALDAEAKRASRVTTAAGASVGVGAAEFKADGKTQSSHSSSSSSVVSTGPGAGLEESLIPYDIEYLGATRSAYANQVRIIFTIPSTTRSDIDM